MITARESRSRRLKPNDYESPRVLPLPKQARVTPQHHEGQSCSEFQRRRMMPWVKLKVEISNKGEIDMKILRNQMSQSDQRFQEWMEQRKAMQMEYEAVANIRDYLDTQTNSEDLKRARKAELKKLNEDFGAFTPRDGREILKSITVCGRKWVDKVTKGVAKSRLTCQDFKRKGAEDKNSSEAPSNFCPTPFGASRKVLEVYSVSTGMPRCKADLTSAFLIAADQGDNKGQPVMMKPPKEWLEDHEEWYYLQKPEVQAELKDVPKEENLWQVDGNIYGRQPAAAQYRDRLDEIIAKEVPKEKYELERGKIDACVYKCKKTATVLLHHIDDFDICGPESASRDLLPVQFPKNGCKLKMGDMEFPNVGSKTTSDILGRTKINVEDAVITKPNEKHINTILKQLGLENAKSSPVPRKKLDLKQDKLLNEKDKATYARCVESAIYLSQDRPDLKYRECHMVDLKTLGRYLRGTRNYGHVTKLEENADISKGLTLHCFCDSNWAANKTSGSFVFGRYRFWSVP